MSSHSPNVPAPFFLVRRAYTYHTGSGIDISLSSLHSCALACPEKDICSRPHAFIESSNSDPTINSIFVKVFALNLNPLPQCSLVCAGSHLDQAERYLHSFCGKIAPFLKMENIWRK
jgi:hypothetical protein